MAAVYLIRYSTDSLMKLGGIGDSLCHMRLCHVDTYDLSVFFYGECKSSVCCKNTFGSFNWKLKQFWRTENTNTLADLEPKFLMVDIIATPIAGAKWINAKVYVFVCRFVTMSKRLKKLAWNLEQRRLWSGVTHMISLTYGNAGESAELANASSL